MNRLWLGLGLLLGVIGIVGAQQISMPPPAGVTGIACAYNTSPPTLTTGNPGWVQCDSTGKIITSGTASGANVGATGAAVPASAGYDGINVAGILRGWTGSNPSGSIFAGQIDVASIAGTTTPTGSGVMNAGTQRVALATDSPGIVSLGQTTKAASVPVTIATDQGLVITSGSQYPSGATAITISATGTTGATTATLAAVGGKTTYICGLSIRATATAAAVGNATVTGTVTGTLNFTQFSQAASTGMVPLEPNLGSVCIPASTTNTAIAVISAAPGTGGVVSVTAWGYQL